MKISGSIVDPLQRRIFTGSIEIEQGVIVKISEHPERSSDKNHFIMPGFIDAHVHIESSMLPPKEFARLAANHGTIATVSDPHEIANVLGVAGVDYMLQEAENAAIKIFLGAPSCVPATNDTFETSGAVIDATQVEELLRKKEILYLSEMMNFPGVLHGDEEVLRKIQAAKALGKKIDGHAPGLTGEAARKYAEAGISSDHECFTLQEALDKLSAGMKIIIREGSAAKNYSALSSLLSSHPSEVMLCSDDKHPNDLIKGHINKLVSRAIRDGHDLFDVLQAACVNPVVHYPLPVGLLREGDDADFIVVEDLEHFDVVRTFVKGELVSENGRAKHRHERAPLANNFCAQKIELSQLRREVSGPKIRVIEVHDNQLVTGESVEPASCFEDTFVSSVKDDLLKIVVANRYHAAPPAVACVRNFGLKKGALASSVAHDCHNIVAVGVADEDILQAINTVFENSGGLAFSHASRVESLALPIAGLMSDEPGERVAEEYETLDALAKEFGSDLDAPFMTLSFLALLVIPKLKLSDKGLFNGESFEFVDLFLD